MYSFFLGIVIVQLGEIIDFLKKFRCWINFF